MSYALKTLTFASTTLVLSLAAAPAVEHSALEHVAARSQRLLQPPHEDAEVGIRGPGVHLGDEQDLHA